MFPGEVGGCYTRQHCSEENAMDNAAVTAEEERSTLKQKVRGAACRFSCQRGGSFCMLSILLEALKDHCSDVTMFKLGIG